MSEAQKAQLGKLQQHFSSIPDNEQTPAWEVMWQQKTTPWDRSKPNPALVDALDSKKDLLGPAVVNGERKKALVPGCGGGYDILLLASHGYDALGIDAASSAIEACKTLQATESKAETKQYPVKNAEVGSGKADFLKADFFNDEGLAAQKFDLIYDYTFLCALPPTLRSRWSKKMSSLLSPEGVLICMEFPLGKPASASGPPHGLTEVLYEELLKTPGVEPVMDKNGSAERTDRSVANDGLKRIDRWVPEKSHHAGQGMDAVSIWKHAA